MVDRHEAKKTFHDFHLSAELLKALDAIGYVNPTPVQAASIPLIMAGIDLIVQSQTGTGKTAAFGIPIVEVLEPDPGRIEVLVLAPTRELAKQVSDEFSRLTQHRPISSTAIYGGSAYGPQLEAIKTAQIVCATPGRLLDLLKQRELSLEHLRFFILDEADEMLSMGFERDLRAVLEYLPEERQSLLFSATVTSEVKALSRNMLFYPEFLGFSSESLVNLDVSHEYYKLSGIARSRDLLKILELEEPDNALIFANTKDDTFTVTTFLQRHGYRAEVLNGDLAQAEREKTLLKLRTGDINYIVATDVAARGIDISELSHVINYVLPETPETYVHRTGRTGRAGKKGRAISLISPAEMSAFIQIRKRVDTPLHERTLPNTRDIVAAKRARRQKTLLSRVTASATLDAARFHTLAASLLETLRAEHADAAESTALLARLLTIADHALDARGELRSTQQAVVATPTAAAPAALVVSAPAAPPHEEEAQAPIEAIAPTEPEVAEVVEAEVVEAEVVEAEVVEAEAPANSSREPRRDRRGGRGRNRDRERDQERPVEEAASLAQPIDPSELAAAEELGAPSLEELREVETLPILGLDDEDVAEAPRQQRSSDRDSDDGGNRRGGRRRRRGRNSRDGEEDRRGSRPTNGNDRRNTPSSRNDDSARRGGAPSRNAGPVPAPAPVAAAAVISGARDMSKMRINVGQGLFKHAKDVLEFLIYNSGMDEEDFGEVQLERAQTVVEVREDYALDVVSAIHELVHEGTTLVAYLMRK